MMYFQVVTSQSFLSLSHVFSLRQRSVFLLLTSKRAHNGFWSLYFSAENVVINSVEYFPVGNYNSLLHCTVQTETEHGAHRKKLTKWRSNNWTYLISSNGEDLVTGLCLCTSSSTGKRNQQPSKFSSTHEMKHIGIEYKCYDWNG
jgi:hypothetical protein